MPRFLKRKMRNLAVKYHNGTYNLSCDYEGSRYTAWVDENLNNDNYFIYKNTIADGRGNPKTRKIDTSCLFGGSLFEAMKSEASKNLMMFKARRANAELLDERRIKIAKLSMACDLYDMAMWMVHKIKNGGVFSADEIASIDTILNIANGNQKMPIAKSENSDSVVTEQ
ncbi:MAG: hypothetical protein KGZ69_08750 [Methylomonas sp.]|nr:hypothetical protein [Methylomonas sp.]